jgi:predicted DCC family thiol-disulfide oxidoreductase YuxK
MPNADAAPVLVFDGGCVFCRHFAELSELRSGIPGLTIRDGRADHSLRRQLTERGYPLRDGAVVLAGDQVLHGADAIQWLCERMTPSAALLQLLTPLLATPTRAHRLYPLLLLARRLALAVRGLPVDPDAGRTTPRQVCHSDPSARSRDAGSH